MTVDPDPSDPRRTLTPTVLAAGGVAAVGFLLAAVSTDLALAAGEHPVTLLPVGTGLAAILVARAAAVALLAVAVRRWRPRRLAAVLVASGLFWVALAGWQAWLMLART